MKFSLENKIAAGFAAALLLLALFGALAWKNARQFEDVLDSVEHTHQLLYQLEGCLNHLVKIQTESQRYLLTGDEGAVERWSEQTRLAQLAMQRLRQLSADNAAQQSRLVQMEPLANRLVELTARRNALRRTMGLDEAIADVSPAEISRIVDVLGEIIARMERTERGLLRQRGETSLQAIHSTTAWIAMGSIAALALVAGAYLVVGRDFAARRGAEQALRRSEQMFQRLFENSPDAIILVDHNGRIRRANRRAAELFGYGEQPLAGLPLHQLLPERFRARHAAHFATYFAAPRAREMGAGLELFARCQDGSEFPVDILLSPIEVEGERQTLAVIRDITERRQAEKKIHSLNQNLQLQNARLENANKELEAFSYSVSHDLRAPLRHIDGFTGLLTKHAAGVLDAKAQRYLKVISDAAVQMGRLIDDLLAFSRTGRAQLHPGPVDNHSIVSAIIADLSGGAETRIDWQVSALPIARGDASLLRQVWANLISNAVKYSSRSPQPRIEISGSVDRTAGETVFHVRDNGVGFDMQYVDKLFGVFQRLHSDAEFEGTGVGLANVRRIVSRHGGRTWAQGRPGEGATFSFSLPLAPTESAQTSPSSTSHS